MYAFMKNGKILFFSEDPYKDVRLFSIIGEAPDWEYFEETVKKYDVYQFDTQEEFIRWSAEQLGIIK
jgi:hypothetical protein